MTPPKIVIGVPKEIKADEYRVAMIPVGVEELTRAGHKVLIQSGAGLRPVSSHSPCGLPGLGEVMAPSQRTNAGFEVQMSHDARSVPRISTVKLVGRPLP